MPEVSTTYSKQCLGHSTGCPMQLYVGKLQVWVQTMIQGSAHVQLSGHTSQVPPGERSVLSRANAKGSSLEDLSPLD